MHARALIPLLALLPLGCALATGPQPDRDDAVQPGTGSGIVFRTDRTTYALGDTMRLTLRNETDQPLGYNLCSSMPERRSAAGWTRAPLDRVCTAELRTLAPGTEASFAERLTAEWRPGEYRVTTHVERIRSGERGPVATQSFVVRP